MFGAFSAGTDSVFHFLLFPDGHQLGDEAVYVLRQWLNWLFEGELSAGSDLGQIRDELQSFD